MVLPLLMNAPYPNIYVPSDVACAQAIISMQSAHSMCGVHFLFGVIGILMIEPACPAAGDAPLMTTVLMPLFSLSLLLIFDFYPEEPIYMFVKIVTPSSEP
eukprot:14248872-Ditylum_brightwellii.AAC.1